MEQTVKHRQQAYGQLLGWAQDYVAVASCDMIGAEVYLVLPDGQVGGPFMVADCLTRDRAHHSNFVVDLSWNLAKKYHTEWQVLEPVAVCGRKQ